MPPKIRQLERRLLRAGFVLGGGKGSHRKYTHPTGQQVIISGPSGADAKPYQVRQVTKALKRAKS